VLNSASSKARDHSVPLADQANIRPIEEEKKQIKQPSPSFFKEKLTRMLKKTT
nr:hypothetical protein [Tanacetum cinerariifolium]